MQLRKLRIYKPLCSFSNPGVATTGGNPPSQARRRNGRRQHRRFHWPAKNRLVHQLLAQPTSTAAARGIRASCPAGPGPISRTQRPIRSRVMEHGGACRQWRGQWRATQAREGAGLPPGLRRCASAIPCAGAGPRELATGETQLVLAGLETFITHLLPAAARRSMDWLSPVALAHKLFCEWKGVAHYFDLVGGQRSGSSELSGTSPSQRRPSAPWPPGALYPAQWTAAGWMESGVDPSKGGASMAPRITSNRQRPVSREHPLSTRTDLSVKGLVWTCRP